MHIERFEDIAAWQKDSEDRKRANREPDDLSRDQHESIDAHDLSKGIEGFPS